MSQNKNKKKKNVKNQQFKNTGKYPIKNTPSKKHSAASNGKKTVWVSVACAILAIVLIIGSILLVNHIRFESLPEEAEGTTNFVCINVGRKGYMIVELYPDIAPDTVANFQKLVSENFYDGLIFHRIISGFMIQGGDPNGDGTGGSSQTIKGEFSANGFANSLSHTRGVISMARSTSYNSASSQFFICHADATHLDGEYAAFGKLVYGYDVLDAIASVQTNSNNKPLSDVKMKSVYFVSEETVNALLSESAECD